MVWQARKYRLWKAGTPCIKPGIQRMETKVRRRKMVMQAASIPWVLTTCQVPCYTMIVDSLVYSSQQPMKQVLYNSPFTDKEVAGLGQES